MYDRFRQYAREVWPLFWHNWSAPRQFVTAVALGSTETDRSRHVMVVDGQNVADFVADAHTERAHEPVAAHIFGTLRLPAQYLWIEFVPPAHWWQYVRAVMPSDTGMAQATLKKAAVFAWYVDNPSAPERHIGCLVVLETVATDTGAFGAFPWSAHFCLTDAYEWADGQCYMCQDTDFLMRQPDSPWHNATEQLRRQYAEECGLIMALPIDVLLTTLMLLHTKNVVVVTHQPPARQQQKRQQRDRLPLVQTHVVMITPTVTRRTPPARRGTPGPASLAFHLVRGHFADYRDRGLFGKLHGIYWVPQHTRGTLEHGTIKKRYAVVTAPQQGDTL